MQKVVSFILIAAIFVTSQVSAFAAPPAPAAEPQSVGTKRAKVVAKAAIFGFGGGLVVGLASQVFKKKPKNIFLFGSLGMYAGILLGIYVISTTRTPSPYEGPDTYEDFSQLRLKPETTLGTTVMAKRDRFAPASDRLELNFLNITF